MTAYQMSPELRAFAETHVGRLQGVRFCGWPHTESSVWALGGDEQAFLKAFRRPQKFMQERRAYREWLPLPGFSTATPSLLGENSELSALLISACPGELLEHSHLNDVQQLTAYRQAGIFLRALHALPFEDDDPVSLAEAYRQRATVWTKRARGLLEPEPITWVLKQAEETVGLLAHLKARRVPCHRDYSPRNWLIDPSSNDLSAQQVRLSVIDFEHARPDYWLVDVERLSSSGWDSSLQNAFWQGYGRTLNGLEREVLEQRLALSALTTVVWAYEHGDTDFEMQGRRQLESLYRQAN